MIFTSDRTIVEIRKLVWNDRTRKPFEMLTQESTSRDFKLEQTQLLTDYRTFHNYQQKQIIIFQYLSSAGSLQCQSQLFHHEMRIYCQLFIAFFTATLFRFMSKLHKIEKNQKVCPELKIPEFREIVQKTKRVFFNLLLLYQYLIIF